MDTVTLSIVIPTYNRKEILQKCLNHLFDQTYPRHIYEIIVIDDGSNDGTGAMVDAISLDAPVAIRHLRQKKEGPAAARNKGIRAANGKIVLFLGDDMIAAQNLIEEHILWHNRYQDEPVGVLGRITWSGEIEVTPFMRWLENGGPQFSFGKLEGATEADARDFFYSSNISIKKNLLVSKGEFFDEEFPYAAYEDFELGHRLKKAGMVLKYNKNAITFHYHYTSLFSACRRMVIVGEMRQLLAQKLEEDIGRPERPLWREVLSAIKFIIYYLVALYYEKRSVKNHIFQYVMDYCVLMGRRIYYKQKHNR